MKKISPQLLVTVFVSTLLLACSKEDIDLIGANDKNTVTLQFNNRVGGQKIELGNAVYKNAFGEEFTLTTLNYFISNVTLKKADGSMVKFPDQYFLVRQADPATWEPELPNVPAADYKELSFIIGVDSTRSVSDVTARTGILDPASYGSDGMYWSWNSGYIFMKMSGTSSVVPLNSAGNRVFELHVGGYGGRTAPAPNNLRTVVLPLQDMAKVRKNIAPTIDIVGNFAKVFDGANKVKLAETNSVHNPAVAGPIADNYMSMFTVEHIHND